MKLLYLAKKGPLDSHFPEILTDEIRKFGELEMVLADEGLDQEKQAEMIRSADVLLLHRNSARVPTPIAADPGRRQYICCFVGSMRPFVDEAIADSGIVMTNWGDAPLEIAEGAMVLLMAVLKDLHHQIRVIREDGWNIDLETHGGSLRNLNVGIYGCGHIGRRFVELISPFGAVLRVFDPFAKNLPEGVERVETLEGLFRKSQAIVIHAGLTEETKNSVDARMLAFLPDHGIIINTARGGIIDQDALFRELETGRLRAGLDVLEPDWLPPGHPAKRWDNVIFSAHQIYRVWPSDGKKRMELLRAEENCIANLRRWAAGEPLQGIIDGKAFRLMT